MWFIPNKLVATEYNTKQCDRRGAIGKDVTFNTYADPQVRGSRQRSAKRFSQSLKLGFQLLFPIIINLIIPICTSVTPAD